VTSQAYFLSLRKVHFTLKMEAAWAS